VAAVWSGLDASFVPLEDGPAKLAYWRPKVDLVSVKLEAVFIEKKGFLAKQVSLPAKDVWYLAGLESFPAKPQWYLASPESVPAKPQWYLASH